jgi:hypothetical protein
LPLSKSSTRGRSQMRDISHDELSARMSKRLAGFELSDETIKRLVERVLIDGLHIGRFDPCIYGICIDYFTDEMPRLERLSVRHGISKWEVFPYGIIDWDRFRVRIAFEVDELEAKVPARGFHN